MKTPADKKITFTRYSHPMKDLTTGGAFALGGCATGEEFAQVSTPGRIE